MNAPQPNENQFVILCLILVLPVCYEVWSKATFINRILKLVSRHMHSQVIDRKQFGQFPHIRSNDLDIWPSDPKINRGHLLVMTKLYAKFENHDREQFGFLWLIDAKIWITVYISSIFKSYGNKIIFRSCINWTYGRLLQLRELEILSNNQYLW